MSWDPKCPSSGTPNDILFYFHYPLFYWRIVDVRYYTSYRYTTKWFTIFKGYAPFLIKYQLCSMNCTISPWNLFMLDYFSFIRLHWAHVVAKPHADHLVSPSQLSLATAKMVLTPRVWMQRVDSATRENRTRKFISHREANELPTCYFFQTATCCSIPQLGKRNRGNCVLGFLHRVLCRI